MDVAQAKAEIAKILSTLEKTTGQIVRSIGVEAIDVTQYQDASVRHQMMVQIELERLPGHQW